MESTGNGRLPARRRGPGRRARDDDAGEPGGRPEWHEVYTSALVILAGVVVVVGFGFVASRVVNSSSGEDALPDPPPAAALPGALLPSDDPGPIELGSPTPSPSLSLSPSPSESPSSKPTTRPPDQGAITIAAGDVPSRVDLSDEGSRDWVHWGQEGTFSLERDRDGGFAILEGTPSSPRFRHALSPERFEWTGGDPVATSDGTPTGIRTCGDGKGFTITAPAGPATRTLRLYVGVFAARGRLEASLTAGSATDSATITERDADFRSVVYTLRYRAPKSAKISLKWTTQEDFGDGCGGVALEAATLR